MALTYLDSSVALAELLAENRCPPPDFWDRGLTASRLVQYEIFVRLNVLRLLPSHGDAASAILTRVAWIELSNDVLARALEPFPVPLRTFDALHLASIEFMRGQGQEIELATYDLRLRAAAERLGVRLLAL